MQEVLGYTPGVSWAGRGEPSTSTVDGAPNGRYVEWVSPRDSSVCGWWHWGSRR